MPVMLMKPSNNATMFVNEQAQLMSKLGSAENVIGFVCESGIHDRDSKKPDFHDVLVVDLGANA